MDPPNARLAIESPSRWGRYWPRRVGPAEPLAAALIDHHRTGHPRTVFATRADGVCFEIDTGEYFTLDGALGELDALALDRCRGRVLDVGAGAGGRQHDIGGTDGLAETVEPDRDAVDAIGMGRVENIARTDLGLGQQRTNGVDRAVIVT